MVWFAVDQKRSDTMCSCGPFELRNLLAKVELDKLLKELVAVLRLRCLLRLLWRQL